jgi:hypothetical protein
VVVWFGLNLEFHELSEKKGVSLFVLFGAI